MHLIRNNGAQLSPNRLTTFIQLVTALALKSAAYRHWQCVYAHRYEGNYSCISKAF